MGSGFEFSDQESRTSFPVEMVQNGVFFPVKINGSKPLRFTLDLGSGATYVDQKTAMNLGLKFSGTTTVRGAGEGAIPVKVIEDVSIDIPGLVTRGHRVHATDLGSVHWGGPLKGLLGYDFLERFVTIIDYPRAEMTVIEPSVFKYDGPGVALQLELQGRLPFVKGTIEVAGNVVEDLFLVDSGSQDAVDHPLISKSDNTHSTHTGVGLGKPAIGVFGNIDRFQLGPFQMRGLQGVASEVGLGSRLIGGQVLSRYKVIINYPRKELILETNRGSLSS
jgi:Aspartyl protease